MPSADPSPCRLLDDLRLAAEDDDPATVAALASHLESCPHCQQIDQELAPLLAAYRRGEPEPLGADRESRIIQTMCGPAATADPVEESH